MFDKGILAIKYCDKEFYVDKFKISLILTIRTNTNAFKLSDENIIKLIIKEELLNKDFLVNINKI